MLLLLQLISRMQFLEYSDEEITSTFNLIKAGENTLEELCDALNLELPHPGMTDRLQSLLQNEDKFQSGLKIGLLRKRSLFE